MKEGPVTGGRYGVELLYDRAPPLDERLVSALKEARPGATIVNSGPIVAFHHDLPVHGELPAQTAILPANRTCRTNAHWPALTGPSSISNQGHRSPPAADAEAYRSGRSF